MKFLIQILLPVADNEGHALPDELFAALKAELTERFGGLTAYNRSPAEGTWNQGNDISHDDIIIFEVMTMAIDRGWWRDLRQKLEAEFRQEEIVIRAQRIEQL
jgi:hypothetical protein